jgi:16S rRNA (uracil1498-N3)-methyltransferase
MSLPFFYQPDLAAATTLLSLGEETSKHCIQVLRMKTGDQLRLTNGLGLFCDARIEAPDRKKAVVAITDVRHSEKPEKRICIAISPLKNSARFEWFLEKATEIGITDIQPLLCRRTEQAKIKTERLQGILIAAMLQSQQAWLPNLHSPENFEKYVTASRWKQKLIAHCEEDKKQPLQAIANSDASLILIGPEGDFTPAEIALALHNGYMPVSLGDTRLRTETAGMVAAALLMNRNS